MCRVPLSQGAFRKKNLQVGNEKNLFFLVFSRAEGNGIYQK